MAITSRIDPHEHIVYLTTVGDSSFAEWKSAMEAILADPSYRPGFTFLSDRRNQSDVPSANFAHEAVDFLARHSTEMGSFRWAAVTANTAVYGMARMFSIISELKGVRAQAFTDYDEALAWVREQQDVP